MVSVLFLAQRFESLGLYEDISCFNDTYLLNLVLANAKVIVNELSHVDPYFPICEYLEQATKFATRSDERLKDCYADQGIYYVETSVLSDMHLLILSASRLLAQDILYTLTHTLKYVGQIKELTLEGLTGRIWLV